jgi:SAM-dependent methyltransferase
MDRNQVSVDVLQEVTDPVIRALDLSGFSDSDMVNLILQRPEILVDTPRGVRPVRAWIDGDTAPILSEVDRLGDAIPRRVAGVLHAEYRAMRDIVVPLAPKRIADIGCGYAIWDLFAQRDTGAEIVLIDIEQNEHRHFGFAETGSAYTSLAGAAGFLTRNGVPAGKITTINPQTADLKTIKPVDLAVSFASCGFHYPVDAYLDFFRDQVGPKGAILLDVRRGTGRAQLRKLSALGAPAPDLPGHPKGRRILFRRGM